MQWLVMAQLPMIFLPLFSEIVMSKFQAHKPDFFEKSDLLSAGN